MIDETVAELKAMRTCSSSEAAIKAARSLRELEGREYVTVEEFVRDVERNASALRRANPSHASLENALREIERSVAATDDDDVAGAKATLDDAIERVTDDVVRGKEAAAELAADLLGDGDTVLTHDYSSTVLYALECAVADDDTLSVYVTEARPRLLGRRTVRTLAEVDGVDATLIVDSAAGSVLEHCDRVLTGMTCVVENTLYNRVGTNPIASATARTPATMTVTGSGAKVIEDGFIFENDQREETEVIREPPEGFAVENPAYDATPLDLVDELVTDNGVRRP